MKILLFILIPVLSFAQKKDSIKQDKLYPSLNFQLKEQKNDSVKFDLNVNKYQAEALRLRRNSEKKVTDKAFREENLRNDLLKHNQLKGKSNLSL